MTPLGAIALGLLVVVLDLRVSGTDLLVDLVGWMVVVTGLTRLALLDRRFSAVRRWAYACVPLSLVDLNHPPATSDETGVATAPVPPEDALGEVTSLYGIATTVTVVLLGLALRDRARRHDEPGLAARFHLIAVLQAALGLLLAGVGLLIAADAPAPGTAVSVAVVLAALAVQLWFFATLAGARDRPWLQTGAEDDEYPEPREL